jgi:hypothetical protein
MWWMMRSGSIAPPRRLAFVPRRLVIEGLPDDAARALLVSALRESVDERSEQRGVPALSANAMPAHPAHRAAGRAGSRAGRAPDAYS